jgi:hypothetical protein
MRRLAWAAQRSAGYLARPISPQTRDRILAQASRMASRTAAAYARHPAAFPITGRMWERAGLLPVPYYHYYQPIVRSGDVAAWGIEDPVLGIDLRVTEQLGLLGESHASPRSFTPNTTHFVSDTYSSATPGMQEEAAERRLQRFPRGLSPPVFSPPRAPGGRPAPAPRTCARSGRPAPQAPRGCRSPRCAPGRGCGCGRRCARC